MNSETTYSKICLGLEACTDEQFESALYDYVGAVYGETVGEKTDGLQNSDEFIKPTDGDEIESRFDGRLTANEKEYVTRKFGTLTRSGAHYTSRDYLDYLSNAKKVFFGDMADFTIHDCSKLNFVFNDQFHSVLGYGAAIGGGHHCGWNFANLYSHIGLNLGPSDNPLIKGGLEAAIAINPQEWIFFVESIGYGKRTPQEETYFFRNVADALGTSIYEPIIDPQSNRVIEASSIKYGLDENIYRFVIIQENAIRVFNNVLARNDEKLDEPSADKKLKLWNKALNSVIDRMAKQWGMDAAEFKKAAEKYGMFKWQFVMGEGEYKGKQTNNTYRVQELALISNELSVDQVRQILIKNPGKNAFYQMGSMHLDMLPIVYEEKPR